MHTPNNLFLFHREKKEQLSKDWWGVKELERALQDFLYIFCEWSKKRLVREKVFDQNK